MIAGLPGVSVFHSSAWAKILSHTYGFTPIYFTAFHGNKLVSAIPVVEVKSWLTGKRGVSLPFTDESEALGLSDDATARLTTEVLNLGRTRGWRHVEFRGNNPKFQNAQPSLTFWGHKLTLSPDRDALFNQLESSVRRAIRKAQKSGLTVEFSQTLEATREYYALHCQTRKEHGLPPQPFRFFQQIHEHLLSQNLGVVVTARRERQALASAIFFHRDAQAIYKFGASNRAGQDLRANNLVMWEAIQWLANRGVKTLRFGRTSAANEGLRRFKLGWGAQEYPINYFKFDFRKNALTAEKDEAFGWHNQVFRALPVFLARWAGAVLYKHVA